MLLCIVSDARMFPLPSWTRIKPFLGFGLRIQAVGIAKLIRDQGTNAMIAIIPVSQLWGYGQSLIESFKSPSSFRFHCRVCLFQVCHGWCLQGKMSGRPLSAW